LHTDDVVLFSGAAAPTCVEFVQCESNHAVASYADGKVVLYDLETGKVPVVLAEGGGGRRSFCRISRFFYVTK